MRLIIVRVESIFDAYVYDVLYICIQVYIRMSIIHSDVSLTIIELQALLGRVEKSRSDQQQGHCTPEKANLVPTTKYNIIIIISVSLAISLQIQPRHNHPIDRINHHRLIRNLYNFVKHSEDKNHCLGNIAKIKHNVDEVRVEIGPREGVGLPSEPSLGVRLLAQRYYSAVRKRYHHHHRWRVSWCFNSGHFRCFASKASLIVCVCTVE